jgi:hypothetical protein
MMLPRSTVISAHCAEGRRDQDLGCLAHFVTAFVGDEVDAVVVLPPPRDVLATADPEEDAALHQSLGLVAPVDYDVIAATLLWGKGGDRLGVLVGGHGVLKDQGLLGFPLPPAATGLVLDEGIDPLAAIDGHLEPLVGQALGFPVHGDNVHGHFFPGLTDVLLGGQADVELALVDDDLPTSRDDLAVGAADGGFHDELAAARRPLVLLFHGLLDDVPRQLDDQLALFIGEVRTAEHHRPRAGWRPPPAVPADPGVIHVGEAIAAKLGRAEAVGLGQHVPLDGCVGHPTAEEVVDVHCGFGALPGCDFGLVGGHHYLELGRAVGGYLESGRRAGLFDVEVIVAQGSAFGKSQLSMEDAELVQF